MLKPLEDNDTFGAEKPVGHEVTVEVYSCDVRTYTFVARRRVAEEVHIHVTVHNDE
jgi:NADPH-dependent ferric siderophore reductase